MWGLAPSPVRPSAARPGFRRQFHRSHFAARESFYYNGKGERGLCERTHLWSSTEIRCAVTFGFADSTYSTFAGLFSKSAHGLRFLSG